MLDRQPPVPDGPYVPFGVITSHALAWEEYRVGDVVERPLDGLGHGLVCGATGTGKTVAMYPLIWYALRDAAWGTIMVDFKASATTQAALAAAATEAGKPLHVMMVGTPGGGAPVFYDPLAWDGTVDEKTSMLLACFDMTTEGAAAYYTATAQSWLRLTLTLLQVTGPGEGESSMGYLARHTATGQVKSTINQVRAHNPQAADQLATMVPPTVTDKDLAGLRVQLQNLIDPLAPYLTPRREGDGRPTLDLTALAGAGECAYISVAAANPAIVKSVGTLICQHLTAVMAARMRTPGATPMLICIDEASALAEKATVVETLLKQARQADMWVWLATQQLSAWPESVQTAIMGNASTLIILRADDQPSALTLSAACGTGIQQVTNREATSQAALIRETQALGATERQGIQAGAPLLEPSELQKTPPHHAYIIFRTIPGINVGEGRHTRRVPATPRTWRTNPRLKKGWEHNFTYDTPLVHIIPPHPMLHATQATPTPAAPAHSTWAPTPTPAPVWDDGEDDTPPTPLFHTPTPPTPPAWDEDEDEPAPPTPLFHTPPTTASRPDDGGFTAL